MLSFILECGTSTAGSNARLALRIRVNISAIGSFISLNLNLTRNLLPTGLRYPRYQSIERRLAESDPRAAELAQVPTPASAHRAAVDHPRRAGVARQLGQARVIAFGLQLGPQRRVFLDRRRLLLIAFNPCCFCHKFRLLFIGLRRKACPS